MSDIIIDALIDSLKTIPLLLLVYFAIELIEVKYGEKMREKIQKAGRVGPLYASLVGCVPQCGFSVIGSALFSERLITIGTLLAVFIATSDEAIPVILSDPNKASLIWPLIFTKMVIAIFYGFVIDIFLRKFNKKRLDPSFSCQDEHCDKITHHHNADIDEIGCCGHHYENKKIKVKEIIIHPLVHTSKIFLFILCMTLFLNIVIFRIGDENFARLFLGHSFFQPVIAAFFGLIPNCAASVAIAQLYLKDAISFGSTVAGLSTGAGLGILVLFRENKSKKEFALIVGLLLLISISSGILIQLFYK